MRGHKAFDWLQISIALLLMLTAPSIVRAADGKDPKMLNVSADRDHPKILSVLFDEPYPNQSDVSSKDYWIVFGKDKKGTVIRLDVDSVDATALNPTSPNEKSVVLTLVSPMSLDTASVDVTLANSKTIVHITGSNIFQSVPPRQAPLKPCTSKGDCDIYIAGSYTAAIGGTPLYAIDSFAGYMHSITQKNYYGKFGFYGQVQEKSSAQFDPDSILAYFDYQYVLNRGAWFGPFQAPKFNYRVAGAEFNKTGDDVNFVTSPVVTFPIRLSGKLTQPVEQGITFPLVTLQMGTEFVVVKRSVLAPTDTWHTRGLLGATFAGGIPLKKKFLYSIQLTSSYQVRIPSAAEIFFDPKFAPISPTTGKAGTIPPRLGTQPRHYADTKLTSYLVQWFGFTFEHTYGSLPPSFVKTNHTFSLGLCFTLAETSLGRYSILKP